MSENCSLPVIIFIVFTKHKVVSVEAYTHKTLAEAPAPMSILTIESLI